MNSTVELFKTLTTGVYVIGVADGAIRNAFTAAWVMQVSFEPLLLAVSINPNHSSYGLLKTGRGFSVNVLGVQQADLAAHFGKPASVDKLAGVRWMAGLRGIPLLDEALSRFECEYHGECEAGDHRLVLGRVVAGYVMAEADDAPLIYRETGNLDGAAALLPRDLPPSSRVDS